MAHSTAFLFLDECSYEPLDLAALTGVLVPVASYSQVRDEICKIVWNVLDPPPNTVPPLIELHASSLLSEISDKHDQIELNRLRIQIFKSVVKLVNRYRLRVFRVAYLNRREITELMKGTDPQLYGLNFFGIQTALQEILADTLTVPVMDGISGCAPNAKKAPSIDRQLIRAFAQQVRYTHHCRQCEAVAESLSIQNFSNLAEPLFADSEHSTLLQVTDLVSYLLLQVERNELEDHSGASPFRTEVLRCANSIQSDLLHCWKGRMRIQATK